MNYKNSNIITNLKRILKFAWNDFSRNKGANLAAIFVLVITIFLATNLYLFQGVAKFLVAQIQEKIDITAYFKEEVLEEDILKIKDEIVKLSPGIKQVQYVSKEEALQKFTERHKDNPDFMKALEEVGSNPFLASINIKTNLPAQYEQISEFLKEGQFSEFIEKVDYSQKKATIDKVFSITSTVNKFGLILGGVLVLIAILVVFNTTKLAVDSSKDEISTMRLVGASNWFIRGPFIIQGALCGFCGLLICLLLVGLSAFFLSPKLEVIMPGFSIFHYFLKNFWTVLLIQLVFGVGLGIISSFIVVRKYLKI